jgi:hypothetical protein
MGADVAAKITAFKRRFRIFARRRQQTRLASIAAALVGHGIENAR